MYACDKRSNTFIPTAIRNRRKGLRCAKVEARCGARTRDSQIKSLVSMHDYNTLTTIIKYFKATRLPYA
uniref:Transposase n=1 Tax=Heterorhabditis bacteriophora TaxID=37862 RepID=A0A1I7X7A5_HETBA